MTGCPTPPKCMFHYPAGLTHSNCQIIYSAAVATFPGSWVACALYDRAKVSGQVASQMSKQPDFHGARVRAHKPQTVVPNRKATATLTVLLSIPRPRVVTGNALNQAPDSMVDTERRRARSSSFSAPSISRSAVEAARKPSHDFCLRTAVPS